MKEMVLSMRVKERCFGRFCVQRRKQGCLMAEEAPQVEARLVPAVQIGATDILISTASYPEPTIYLTIRNMYLTTGSYK